MFVRCEKQHKFMVMLVSVECRVKESIESHCHVNWSDAINHMLTFVWFTYVTQFICLVLPSHHIMLL